MPQTLTTGGPAGHGRRRHLVAGVRRARSVWSAWSLLSLLRAKGRAKAPVSWSHSKRFAKSGRLSRRRHLVAGLRRARSLWSLNSISSSGRFDVGSGLEEIDRESRELLLIGPHQCPTHNGPENLFPTSN